MSHSLDVYALDREGKPLTGARVKIFIEGILKGGTIIEYTDGDGHAEFETADDYESSRNIYIYVREQSFGPYNISGGAYTVQLE